MTPLEQVFSWVLAASLRAALLTLGVLMLQVLLKRWLSASGRHWLWLPVLLVLLAPVLPQSAWSVQSVLMRTGATTFPTDTPPSVAPRQQAGRPAKARPPGHTAEISWHQLASRLWLAGAATFLVAGFVSYRITLKRVKANALPIPAGFLSRVRALAQSQGLEQPPEVWISTAALGPAVCGIWRPRLLLPPSLLRTLSSAELDHVIRHELAHIQGRDVWLQTLSCLLLAVHWFNPLLWLAFVRARLDREAACDARVLRDASQEQRVAYGHTLLKMECSQPMQGLAPVFVGMVPGKQALRLRLHMVVASRPMSLTMKSLLFALVSSLAFLGLTQAASPGGPVTLAIKILEVPETELAARDFLQEALPATPTGPDTKGGHKVYSDQEINALLRFLSTLKGADLLSAPQVTAKMGQEAKIQVGREYVYELPDKTKASKDLGLTLSARVHEAKGKGLRIATELKILEVDGFALLKGVHQPVFRERTSKSEVVVNAGETVIVEVEPNITREKITEGNGETLIEAVPASTEIPEVKKGAASAVSVRSEVKKKRCFVFITAFAPKGN